MSTGVRERDSGRVRANCISGRTWQPPSADAGAQKKRANPPTGPKGGGRLARWSYDAKQFRGEGLVASRFHFSTRRDSVSAKCPGDARAASRAVCMSARSYISCTVSPDVTTEALGSILNTNHPIQRSSTHVDPAIEELNRIVDQAETLLRSLGEQGGEAADAVRERVTQTLNQAKARLAETATRSRAGGRVARRPDRRLRAYQPVAGRGAGRLVRRRADAADHQVDASPQ